MNIAIIQARLGSVRFPAKVLADLNGKPVIQHVIERAQAIKGIDLVLCAIPSADRALEVVVRSLGVFPVLGSEHDVLGRYLTAISGREATSVMRITADCPVFDPTVAAMVLTAFLDGQADGLQYVSNDTLISGYPDGFDIEVFSPDALQTADAQTHGDDREHVTQWLRAGNVETLTVYAPDQWTGPVKLSIDTPDDLATVAAYLRDASVASVVDDMSPPRQPMRRKKKA